MSSSYGKKELDFLGREEPKHKWISSGRCQDSDVTEAEDLRATVSRNGKQLIVRESEGDQREQEVKAKAKTEATDKGKENQLPQRKNETVLFPRKARPLPLGCEGCSPSWTPSHSPSLVPPGTPPLAGFFSSGPLWAFLPTICSNL